jgi:tellurite resistance protein TerC
MTTKQSLLWTGFWIFLALLFSGYIYATQGLTSTVQYLTIFSLEKMLSMDNLLVIYLIFGYFGITDKRQQHRALTWGIIGAFVFRIGLIASGTYIVQQLTWLLYVFAAFLIYSGYKICFTEDDGYDPNDSKIVSYIKQKAGKTGAFVGCIVAIELSDIMFAVDSIPASFSVSQDMFIILSANLFAIMGPRSLYHAVANGMEMFDGIERYIGIVLALVGASVFVSHLWVHIPETYLMAAVFSILGFGVFKCKGKRNEIVA